MATVHFDFDTPRGYGHMRRLITSALIVAALAIVVAGCGGSGKKPSTGATALAAQTTPPAAAAQAQSSTAQSTTKAGHTSTSPGGSRRDQTQTQTRSQTQATKAQGQTTTSTSSTTGGHAPGTDSTVPAGTTRRHTPKPPAQHPAAPVGTTTTSTTPNWVDTTSNGPTTTIPATSATPGYVGPSPLYCLETAGLNQARAGTEPYVWEANTGASPENDHLAEVFLSGPYQDDPTATNYAQSLTSIELATSGGRWVASAAQTSGLGSQVNKVAACMAAG